MQEAQEEIESLDEGSKESPPSPVANIPIINITMRALWNHKASGTYKDLAGPAGVHPTVASQALSASRDLGLTQSGGKKGLYEFTPEGKEYTRSLVGNRETEAREQLRAIIANNPRWEGIIGFLKTNENLPRESLDIVVDVERKLGKQWSPIMRRRVADALVSILEYAGLAKLESGKLISMVKQDDLPGPVTIARATVKDTSLFPSVFPSFFQQDQRRITDRQEAPRSDFAEFRDENVTIRVRKDLQSIASAKGFLDFVENGVRLSEHAKKAPDTKVGEEAPTKN
jgi:hypothetical protein